MGETSAMTQQAAAHQRRVFSSAGGTAWRCVCHGYVNNRMNAL
ncbi:hypothetical protein ACLPHM_07190 [Paenalcaligenes sp. Me131]